jgi:DNA end-binding protein Ku
MKTFVDLDQIDSRYFEKPYYLLPDGDEADESYTVLRDALAKTKKMAVGQLVMHGREHLIGITAHKKGLMLLILRYANELRKAETYFDRLTSETDTNAVKLATDLVEQESGKFQPGKMPNEYARAVHELVRAKIEQRTPEVGIETKGEQPKVINIMDALKKSMQAKGQGKIRDSMRKKMGKAAPKPTVSKRTTRPSGSRRNTAH